MEIPLRSELFFLLEKQWKLWSFSNLLPGQTFFPPSNPFSSQVVGAEIKKGGIGKSREKQTITSYKHKLIIKCIEPIISFTLIEEQDEGYNSNLFLEV